MGNASDEVMRWKIGMKDNGWEWWCLKRNGNMHGGYGI